MISDLDHKLSLMVNTRNTRRSGNTKYHSIHLGYQIGEELYAYCGHDPNESQVISPRTINELHDSVARWLLSSAPLDVIVVEESECENLGLNEQNVRFCRNCYDLITEDFDKESPVRSQQNTMAAQRYYRPRNRPPRQRRNWELKRRRSANRYIRIRKDLRKWRFWDHH